MNAREAVTYSESESADSRKDGAKQLSESSCARRESRTHGSGVSFLQIYEMSMLRKTGWSKTFFLSVGSPGRIGYREVKGAKLGTGKGRSAREVGEG
jgi:hypothetical protein